MLMNIGAPHMRGITGLELAAGVFTQCGSQLATQVEVSLTSGKRDRGRVPLRIGINGDIYGGMLAPLEVGTRRVDIAYVNPASLVAMAYRGKGYYKQKLQLRVLACFPSWDRIAIVVDKKLGVTSLFDIVRRKIPLRVSTRLSASTTVRILRRRPFFPYTGCLSLVLNAGAAALKNAAGRLRLSVRKP
jgi:hypothetical protein